MLASLLKSLLCLYFLSLFLVFISVCIVFIKVPRNVPLDVPSYVSPHFPPHLPRDVSLFGFGKIPPLDRIEQLFHALLVGFFAFGDSLGIDLRDLPKEIGFPEFSDTVVSKPLFNREFAQ